MASVINVNRLIALRVAKGWDQKQLAETAGIDRSVISRIERNLQLDCRLSVIVAIAAALQAPVEHLIDTDSQEGVLEPEIDAAFVRIRQESAKIQRQAALILNAFLDGFEQER
jgi:transcriptional regulator with XRE-family HTH domain